MKRMLLYLMLVAVSIVLTGCRTPLVDAIQNDQGATVKTLIDKGADINAIDSDYFAPLHWAAYYGKTDIVKILIGKGAQVNVRSTYYGTPLIVAAQYGFTDTVRVLLENGADVNLTDASGRTALAYAEDGRFETMIRLLKDATATQGKMGSPMPLLRERTAALTPPPAPNTPGAAEKPEGMPIPVQRNESLPPPASGLASPMKVAVFHFRPLNMESSHYGASAANALTAALKKDTMIIMLDRKDLEMFLAINDLKQDERIDNVTDIGTKLGINFIVAGNIEKRGSLIITNCQVVNIDRQEVIFRQQYRSFGEASLVSDVTKAGDAIIEAITRRIQ